MTPKEELSTVLIVSQAVFKVETFIAHVDWHDKQTRM
jgi:hypothetical protein